MLAGFPLFEVLTDAEDDFETGFEGQLDLLDELFVGFAVILPALGVAEDGIAASCRFEHVYRHFTGIGALGMVCAVLRGKADTGSADYSGYRAQMCEGRSDDQTDFRRYLVRFFQYCFGEFDALGNGGVHLPVPGYYFPAHN